MKTTKWFFILVLSCSFHFAQAQGILDKVDNVLNRADKASSQSDRAGKTVGKLGKLFGKGKVKKSTEAEQVSIVLLNADLGFVRRLNTAVKQLKGVHESDMKFNAEKSLIVVTFEGTAEDLLSNIQDNSPSTIRDEYITEIEARKFTLKLK